jgi:hypothetical protein
LIRHYGIAQLKRIQKDQLVIYMSVDFNYNQRTFLPTEPPDLLAPSDLQELNPTLAQAGRDQYASCLQRVANLKDACVFVVLLNFKGIFSIMPNLITDVSKVRIQGASSGGGTWNDIVQDLFGAVPLQSSVFDSWLPLQQQNIKQQLNALVRNSPHYQPFLVNALHILTTKPQHKTHIVMIKLSMGMGLGQIDKLTEFQVWTVEKVKKELRKNLPPSHHNSPAPATLAQYEAMLDMENHPVLLASRQTRPNNVLLPVLFIGKPIVHISPELLEIHAGQHEIISPKASAARAHQHFTALTNIAFANNTVTSPGLH